MTAGDKSGLRPGWLLRQAKKLSIPANYDGPHRLWAGRGRRSRLGGVIEHDLGEARQGLEFSVDRDAADAIDAFDASAPDNAEDDFRAAGESEGLSDHQETSSCVRMSHGPWRMRLAFGKAS